MNTKMTAGALAGKLGLEATEDLALDPEAEVTILDDGTVNAIERGALIAAVARLTPAQLAAQQGPAKRRPSSTWTCPCCGQVHPVRVKVCRHQRRAVLGS